jgi:hypothetical protein
MLELSGNSSISLEGDLSYCRFSDVILLSRDETSLLKRNTTLPRQDFAVLKLTPETVGGVFKQIMAAGLKKAIIHVQIERSGLLELAAYDNFSPDCVLTGSGVSLSFLDELKDSGVIRSFQKIG